MNNQRRHITELTLWLIALVVALVLTSSEGWQENHARRSPAAAGAQTFELR